jgi:hypothetical protein
MWGLGTSILFPLFCDMAVSHRTPFFPQDIADALAALPEPRALVSSPVHLDAFLRANVGPLKIDQIFSATAPMSADLAQELERRFGARVIEVFGCSEAGIIARRYTASETAWQLSRTISVDVNSDRVLIQAPHLPEDVILHYRAYRRPPVSLAWPSSGHGQYCGQARLACGPEPPPECDTRRRRRRDIHARRK